MFMVFTEQVGVSSLYTNTLWIQANIVRPIRTQKTIGFVLCELSGFHPTYPDHNGWGNLNIYRNVMIFMF
ncbi:hypothetical protein CUU52_09500 [Pectobacterium polaris]|nr:hypothetical protein [Pectobacterium polaris]